MGGPFWLFLEAVDHAIAGFGGRAAVQEQHRAFQRLGQDIRQSISPISANWVKMSARSPSARISSSISTRRSSLPLRLDPIGHIGRINLGSHPGAEY